MRGHLRGKKVRWLDSLAQVKGRYSGDPQGDDRIVWKGAERAVRENAIVIRVGLSLIGSGWCQGVIDVKMLVVPLSQCGELTGKIVERGILTFVDSIFQGCIH
jgi:hypothetical protein